MCKVSDHQRKCTDLGCCGLFLAWWLTWLIIAAVALDRGDPIMLVYGQDYQGAQCGVNDPGQNVAYTDHKDQEKVVYPRLNQDLEDWMYASPEITNIQEIDWYNLGWDVIKNLNLTGVCVSSCPILGDVICTDYYNDKYSHTLPLDPIEVYQCNSATNSIFQMNDRVMCDNCWTMSINTTDVFNRCLELVLTNEEDESSCIYPKGIPADDPDCITLQEIVTLTSVKPAYSNPLAETLGAAVQEVGKIVADVYNASTVIWVCGLVLTLVLSFMYIIFLYWCAAPLVWLTIITYAVLHVFLTIWLWMQSGYIDGTDWLIREIQEQTESVVGNITYLENVQVETSNETNNFYLAAAIVCSILLVIGLGMIISLFQKIRIAVAIIQETSKSVMAMPTMLLYPAWSILCMVLLFIYFFTVGVYLATMDDVTTNDLAASTGYVCDAGCNSTLNYTFIGEECGNSCSASQQQSYIEEYMISLRNNGTLNCTNADIHAQVYGAWNCGVGMIDKDTSLNTFFFWFHIFSFLWNANFIDAIGITVIAGAVCQWYWIRPTGEGTSRRKRMPSWCPLLSAYSRVFRFHLGSMAYGSAIVAIVQLLRLIMAYIDQKTKDLQKNYCIVRILMKVVHCLLWCFEKSIKFITKNAYIYVAMRGYSFCKAARNAFSIFLHNMAQFGVTTVIASTFIFIGKVTVTCASAMTAYAWIVNSSDFEDGAEHELYIPILPCVLTGLLAYFATTYFLNVYDLAIASILVCFCEDYRMHVKTGNEEFVYMSKSLRKLVLSGVDVVTAEQEQQAIKDKKTMNELKAEVKATK